MLASNALIKVTPGLMIWTIVAFLITLFVLKRFAFGPIQKTIDERRALIGQARGQAEQILTEARKVADAQRERVREETEADRQRRLEDTRRQIEAETRPTPDQIRAEVAEPTAAAAEK